MSAVIEELSDGYAKALRETNEVQSGDIAFASLNSTEVGPV